MHLPAQHAAHAVGIHYRPAGLYVHQTKRGSLMGSVIKKRRKRMSKKKHRKMLRRTRVQRRKLGK